MDLTNDTVRSIAELARLELSDTEIELYAEQLSHILHYFEKLEQLDTSHIEPTASVLPLKNVLRKDIASEPLSPEIAVANGPDTQDNQFRVNAVLEE